MESIPEAFSKVVDLGLARGHTKICDLPGALVMKLDDNWTVAMHGHDEPTDVPEQEGCMGIKGLAPCTVAIYWNGWIAGLVDAGGGQMAWGAAANEDTFIEALDAAIERAKSEE